MWKDWARVKLGTEHKQKKLRRFQTISFLVTMLKRLPNLQVLGFIRAKAVWIVSENLAACRKRGLSYHLIIFSLLKMIDIIINHIDCLSGATLFSDNYFV